MKVRTPFTNAFANAFSSVQAWRTTSFVFAALFAFVTIQLVRLADHQNALLIPQGLALSQKPVMVNLGEPYSPDYISKVAEGDAHFLLDWTPDNVEEQYGVFASRLTPELYSKKSPALRAEAAQDKTEGLSQSFYRTRSQVKDNEVTLNGILVRNLAGKEIFRGPATYIFDYDSADNGLLQVSGVSQPDAHAPVGNKTAN
jgi:hypothetical protein